jgi:RNA polymerase sigma-70 factor (ECF subfamily)
VARGDEAAFTQLYDRFSAPQFSFIRQMTNDDTEAEDALSEGFAQIWRRASTYDSQRSAPFTWAVMLIRNKTIDRLRVRKRVARVRDEAAARLTPDEDVDAQSMLAPHLRERVRMVRQIILTLPDEQRTPVEMNFFDGLTHEEIAEQLSTPLGTIKARIRRALQKLRGAWKEDV